MWSTLGIGLLVDTLHGTPPESPSQAWSALHQLQAQHVQQREALEETLRQSFRAQRSKYFRSHRYDFFPGEPEPKAVVGPEFEPQKEKREEYEALQRWQLLQQQRGEMDAFLDQSAPLARSFLRQNQNRLEAEETQRQLQDLLTKIKQECFQILQAHERQLWLQDVPLDEKLQASALSELAKLAELEHKHLTLEQQFPQLQTILQEQKKASAARRAELNRTLLQRTREELQKPEFLREDRKGPARTDLAQVLPAYLVATLAQLGITSV